MKKSIFITLLCGILSFLVTYAFLPQYSEDDVKFAEGIVTDTRDKHVGSTRLWICELDHQITFYLQDRYIGRDSDFIGETVKIGYVDDVDEIKYSAYHMVHFSTDDVTLITVEEVNRNNLIGYFVVPLIVMAIPGIWVIVNMVEFFRKRKEAKNKLAKKREKEERKKRQREKRLGSD